MNQSHSFERPLDPSFSDPSSSLLVIAEETELSIRSVHDALEGLAWIGETAASLNLQLRQCGRAGGTLLEIPPEGFAALMTILSERLRPALENPGLDRVVAARTEVGASL